MYVTKSPATLAGTCSEHSLRYAVLACHREGILASGRRIVHRYSSGHTCAGSGRGYVDLTLRRCGLSSRRCSIARAGARACAPEGVALQCPAFVLAVWTAEKPGCLPIL
jgi:hypothetical protein